MSIAVAGRTGAPARLEVSAPISDGTSTSASEVTTTDTPTVPTTSTTQAPAETTPAQSSTTPSAGTDASVVPTSTSEPATGVGPVAGTYFGVEHFALFTGRCAFLDHHIVGMFRSGDGATWDFHQDYCGTLQGDLWSAVGTFALTASGGATITGTVTETNIRVPSPGVPYTLDVTAGTRQFPGRPVPVDSTIISIGDERGPSPVVGWHAGRR